MVLPLLMMAGGTVLNGMGEQQGADAMAGVQHEHYLNTLKRQQTLRDLVNGALPKFGAAGMEAGIERGKQPAVAATGDIGNQTLAYLNASHPQGAAFDTALGNGVQNAGQAVRTRALNDAQLTGYDANQDFERQTLAQLANDRQMVNDQGRIEDARLGSKMARAGRKGNTLRSLGSMMSMAGGGMAQSSMWQSNPNDPLNIAREEQQQQMLEAAAARRKKAAPVGEGPI